MRLLRRLIKFGLALLTLSILAILGGAWLTKPCSDLPRDADYDIAVVLGGGMDGDFVLVLGAVLGTVDLHRGAVL